MIERDPAPMAVRGVAGRRIAIIAVVVAALVAVAWRAYVYQQGKFDREALSARDRGRAAFEAGDYESALEGLARYLQRFAGREATAADLVQYARAQQRIAEPKRTNLLSAMASLRMALALDPHDHDTQKQLLDLYVKLGYATETLDLVEKMLKVSPGDVSLARTRLEVLVSLRRWDDAHVIARQINERTPDDFGNFWCTLEVFLLSGTLATEVEAWTAEIVAAHPNDVKYELLQAAASQRLHPERSAATAAILDRVVAGTGDCTDDAFVVGLVAQLDLAGRFGESLRVLGRIENSAGENARRELLRRLSFEGRWADILARIERWHAGSAVTEPETLALQVLALERVGRKADAAVPRETLAGSKDSTGKGWCAFLAAAESQERGNRLQLTDSLRKAALADPGNPLLRQAMGDALAAMGEFDLAIESWTAASERAPSWALPLRLVARAKLRTPGAEEAAVAAARAAFARAPNDLDAIVTLVDALGRGASTMDPDQRASLLKDIDAIRAQVPEHAGSVTHIEVELLLAQEDKPAAERAMRAALASATPMSEPMLLRLAELARESGIPLESAFIDRSESAHGVTAQSALARTSWSPRGEATDERLGSGAGAEPATDDAVSWAAARASLLETNGDPRAGPAWVTVADDHPNSIEAQLGALRSAAVWSDRAAVERIIERTRALTGEHATAWRIARARWLLSSQTDGTESIAAAALILAQVCQDAPEGLAARMLFAQALERLGDLRGAEDQLEVASGLAKNVTWVALELARLAQRQGHGDDVRRNVERALRSHDLEPAAAERAAYLLALQGDFRRGAGLLETSRPLAGERRESVLLLARLYARLGETARAIELCATLLAAPDTEVVELAADLHASIGHDGEAENVFTRLDTLDLQPGDRELIRARHASNWGRAEDAIQWFGRAVASAPQRSDVWTAYLVFGVSTSNASAVSAVLEDPRAAGVDAVQFASRERALVNSVLVETRLRPILVAAIEDAASRTAIVDALRTILRDWKDAGKRLALSRAVGKLAEANSRVLELQLLAADLYAAVGDAERGLDIARGALSQFPDSAEAARQAAGLHAASGRWNEALAAGLLWRDRNRTQSLHPELFVARAMIRTGRASDAAEALRSRVAVALAHPAANEEFLLTYAIALARTKRSSEASKLVADLVRDSDRWRVLPLMISSEWLDDAETTSSWLDACAKNVRDTDVTERIQLARAWGAAGQRFKAPPLVVKAREVIARVVASPDAPAEAHFVAALLAQQAGETENARKDYVAAVAKDGGNAHARNNLAMLLADSGDCAGAVENATKASDAAPTNPHFLDTLAYALRKCREFGRAETSLRRAIDLDPANPEWQVSLAEVLDDQGKTAEVTDAIARLEELAAANRGFPVRLRRRVEDLRIRQR